MKLKFVSTLITAAICSISAHASTPRALPNTYGMFLSESPYTLPANYFLKKTLTRYEGGSDNYVLQMKPTNASGVNVNLTMPWNSSAFAVYPGWFAPTNWTTATTKGLPSFTEPYGANGQCVAFAKVATADFHGTSSWQAGSPVIFANVVSSDISGNHAGKMIAYFGPNTTTGTQYPQYDPQNPNKAPGHVGMFLKYAYDRPSPPYQIIGFWIADENYEGTGSSSTPDGQIRKHLIRNNPIPNASGTTLPHTFATNYWFVNIQ